MKNAAAEAGRDPDEVKVWSCFATVSDDIPEERRLMKTVGRLATYLQGYGDLLVSTNNWDPAVLERFRADEVVTGFRGGIDVAGTPDVLAHVATLIPDEWLAPMATGSPGRVRRRGARASSPSAATASSCTAPRRRSSPPSWRPTRADRRSVAP